MKHFRILFAVTVLLLASLGRGPVEGHRREPGKPDGDAGSEGLTLTKQPKSPGSRPGLFVC